MSGSALVAIGGNSLIRPGERGTIEEQFHNARVTARSIAELAARGYRLVITHGNGPQVGSQLLRSEAGSTLTYTLPLDVCVAMTQGEIGYALQNSLQGALRERSINASVVTVITQVVVEKNDPAFLYPTKPIGPFYSREAAERKRDTEGWDIMEDAARGYRRVVASPKPADVLELDVIRSLIEKNHIVIAAGGGGIPVVYTNGSVKGVEAVIDKDRSSALLASELGIETFVISTDVEQVYIHYKKPDQRPLLRIGATEAQRLNAEGHFAEGSMKPKIEAALMFLSGGGTHAVITSPEKLADALDGNTGTHIVPDEQL